MSISLLDVRSPSAPHCLMYCTCNPLKAPFVIGRRPVLNSSNYLCSQWYADPHLSDSPVTTSCLFGDKGDTRGEGLPLRCAHTPVVKAHCALEGRRETRVLIASCSFIYVGHHGIIIRSKEQRDVLLHTVDLEFWVAHAAHSLSMPLVCESCNIATDSVFCQRQSNSVGKCSTLARVHRQYKTKA